MWEQTGRSLYIMDDAQQLLVRLASTPDVLFDTRPFIQEGLGQIGFWRGCRKNQLVQACGI